MSFWQEFTYRALTQEELKRLSAEPPETSSDALLRATRKGCPCSGSANIHGAIVLGATESIQHRQCLPREPNPQSCGLTLHTYKSSRPTFGPAPQAHLVRLGGLLKYYEREAA